MSKTRNLKYNFIIFIILMSITSCCSFHKKYYQALYNKQVISAAYIPYQPMDTFQVVVLAFEPGAECTKKDTFCSICFGAIVPTGEIVEIQSACFTDSTIKPGDKLKVVSYKNYLPHKWKRNTKYIRDYRDYVIHPLHALTHKTTYGELIKLD